MFRSGRMRPADGPSNGSATLSRIRSLVDYTIAMLESSFRKRQPRKPRGTPKLQPAGTSGSDLGRLDLQDFAGARDRDRPRLHRLRDLALEVDVQEPVLQPCALDHNIVSDSTIGRALKKTLFSPIAASTGSSRRRLTARS